MLKTIQVRLQQCINPELPDVQAEFRKGIRPEINLPTSIGSQKKQEDSKKKKKSTTVSWTTLKPLTAWITTNWKILKEMGVPDCRGPAPVDPGTSKGGRHWRGKTCLLIDIRLD